MQIIQPKSQNVSSEINWAGLQINTLTTLVMSASLFGLMVLNNTLGLTNQISFSVNAVSFLLGLVLFSKTSVDGVLLMTTLITRCVTQVQIGWAIAGTTVVNTLAVEIIGGIWILVSDLPWLVYSLITLASIYLLYLAYEGYVEITSHHNEEGEATEVTNFSNKSNTAVAAVAMLELSLLYGDGAAANMELLTPANFTSLMLGMVVGQLILSTIALLTPQETVVKLAQNTTFHIVGILAFLGLGVYGLYEAFEGVMTHYGNLFM